VPQSAFGKTVGKPGNFGGGQWTRRRSGLAKGIPNLSGRIQILLRCYIFPSKSGYWENVLAFLPALTCSCASQVTETGNKWLRIMSDLDKLQAKLKGEDPEPKTGRSSSMPVVRSGSFKPELTKVGGRHPTGDQMFAHAS
jgi:hypothetical protein